MAESQRPPILSYARRLWLHGFLVGFGAVVLILAACYSLGGGTCLSRDRWEMKASSVPTQMRTEIEPSGCQTLHGQAEEF